MLVASLTGWALPATAAKARDGAAAPDTRTGKRTAARGADTPPADRSGDPKSDNAAGSPSGKAKAKPAADAAKQLRAEWKIGDLKLTREAVDDASFAPDIKASAIAAVDWFLQQQEDLLAEVERSPQAEAKARKARPQLEAQFKRKMAAIYDDEKLMAELGRRLRALDKELDDMATSADRMFAKLDSVGLTAAQREKIRPVVQEANAKLKRVVEKSPTRSTKDQTTRDEIVKHYKEARAKVRQHLTPEQREKLAKKNAEE
jgi:hypothetical protein